MTSNRPSPDSNTVRTMLGSLEQGAGTTELERERILQQMLSEYAEASLVSESEIQMSVPTLTNEVEQRREKGLRQERFFLQAAVILIGCGALAVALLSPQWYESAPPADGGAILLHFDGVSVEISAGPRVEVVDESDNLVVISASDQAELGSVSRQYALSRPAEVFGGMEATDFFEQQGIVATPRPVRSGEIIGQGWILSISQESDAAQDCELNAPCLAIAELGQGLNPFMLELGHFSKIDIFPMPDGGAPLVVFALDPTRTTEGRRLLELRIGE